MRSASEVVLDASALLALLNEEEGAESIALVAAGATISAVNCAEVVGKLLDAGVSERAARAAIDSLALEVVPFDFEAALAVGAMKVSTKAAGLSLADRACLALAAALGATAWTTDRAWRGLRVGAEIHVVRSGA